MVIGDTVTAKTAVIGEIATILAAPEDVIIEVANPTICTHMTPKDVVNFPNRKIKRSVYSQIIKLFDLHQ